MSVPCAYFQREQSPCEEIANSMSHGIALIAALAATPPLLSQALRKGEAGSIIGTIIFVFTMVLLYLASSLYHAVPPGKAKDLFKTVEPPPPFSSS
jgi:hemolysin III